MTGPSMPMAPPAMLHDVTVVRRKKYGCAKVEAVPPEEFGITRRAKSIADAGYCFHETNRTEADLIAEGYDAEQVSDLATASVDQTEEEVARNTIDEDQSASAALNKSNRPVRVTEHYVRMDYKGDGKARLYKVTTGGETTTILERDGKPDIEEVDVMPFASMTPIIMTHRFFGRSIADLVMDIQKIKTFIVRALIDNLALTNNNRYEVGEDGATKNTIDDLLTNRPGGIVRTKRIGSVQVLQSQSIGNFAYPLIEYYDNVREWRTGVTRQGQGLNPDTLQNIGEQAVLDAADAARARVRLIARIFAETGIRDLFLLFHGTIRKNDSKQNTIRLRNKWVTVDPRNWKTRNDMTVNVGLGTGSKAQQMSSIMGILNIQKEAILAPQLGLVDAGKIYNSVKRLVEISGLKSVGLYFNDPDAKDEMGNPKPKPETPPDPKLAEAQARIAADSEKAKADAQLAIGKAQMDLKLSEQRGMAELQIREREMAAEMAFKQRQLDAEMAMKERQITMEMALKERQLSAELALKRDLEMARIAAGQAMANVGGTSQVRPGGDPG